MIKNHIDNATAMRAAVRALAAMTKSGESGAVRVMSVGEGAVDARTRAMAMLARTR